MRLLHTSDWHVGRMLRGHERYDEHRAVLAEIAEIARDRAVDAVIVAGDLFESSAPAPEAERIVYRALLDLADIAPVVVVSGNHDNDRRLLAVEPALAQKGRITTAASIAKPGEGGIVEIDGRDGARANIAMLPWISHRYVVKAQELMDQDAGEHAGAYAERMANVINALAAGFGEDTVNVFAGHAMVAGGVLGGGERTAHTIFDYCISATAFPAAVHYVALGHLHRPQQLGAQPPVWYCGSPLQLDFGETEDRKSVLIVEATPRTPAVVEQLPLSSGRRLRVLKGSLQQLAALAGTTGDDYLRIVVREEARAGLADDVRAMFGECAVDVMIETSAERSLGLDPRAHEGKAPGDLFREYLAERKATDERVVALFDRLLEEEYASPPA
ncbi:MAG TPA: exonuclease SbcCD subunit D [Actinomycetota bacterium]|nr:exonuclease SbcCD subunit D [Actinomycetota bacterium]